MKRLRPAAACLLLLSCGGPDGAAQPAPERAVAAADPSCRLPLRRWDGLWGEAAREFEPLTPAENLLLIEARGALRWNGAPVDLHTARLYFATAGKGDPKPIQVVRASRRAPCDRVRRVLAVADEAFGCTPKLCWFGPIEVAPGELGTPPD